MSESKWRRAGSAAIHWSNFSRLRLPDPPFRRPMRSLGTAADAAATSVGRCTLPAKRQKSPQAVVAQVKPAPGDKSHINREKD
jgi:hypothetical protein